MSKPELTLNIEILESDSTPKTDVRLLDQNSSTVFCKICHSGGSSEQLLHPCFCKGNV